eukprot:m.64538 g.64538  ORF g.64538 m.64538 type:complete len:541 (-) comp11656_c0_seq4:144-1766(-)
MGDIEHNKPPPQQQEIFSVDELITILRENTTSADMTPKKRFTLAVQAVCSEEASHSQSNDEVDRTFETFLKEVHTPPYSSNGWHACLFSKPLALLDAHSLNLINANVGNQNMGKAAHGEKVTQEQNANYVEILSQALSTRLGMSSNEHLSHEERIKKGDLLYSLTEKMDIIINSEEILDKHLQPLICMVLRASMWTECGVEVPGAPLHDNFVKAFVKRWGYRCRDFCPSARGAFWRLWPYAHEKTISEFLFDVCVSRPMMSMKDLQSEVDNLQLHLVCQHYKNVRIATIQMLVSVCQASESDWRVIRASYVILQATLQLATEMDVFNLSCIFSVPSFFFLPSPESVAGTKMRFLTWFRHLDGTFKENEIDRLPIKLLMLLRIRWAKHIFRYCMQESFTEELKEVVAWITTRDEATNISKLLTLKENEIKLQDEVLRLYQDGLLGTVSAVFVCESLRPYDKKGIALRNLLKFPGVCFVVLDLLEINFEEGLSRGDFEYTMSVLSHAHQFLQQQQKDSGSIQVDLLARCEQLLEAVSSLPHD